MRTGEGKTLTSTLAVYLTGLTGRGVHVVTVNDYLAGRDAEWMGQLYEWLGLSVGLIVPGSRGWEHKRRQYACDVTYGTNNELGFDYLRDNMAMARSEQVQRGHHYCIVDEIDSILIDEARTPLIISGQVADAAKLYTRFASIARGLQRDVHYEVDEEKRTVAPIEEGVHAVERVLGIENLYDLVAQNLVHQLQASLRAKELYRRDRDYIVDHSQVKIVDEFTGRVLEGRRWSDGLHQAVEAKEGVAIKEENQTLATITLLPDVRAAGRHDRNGPDRGQRVRVDLQPARGQRADQPPRRPRRPFRPDLQERGCQVRGVHRGHTRAQRAGPAGAGGHRLG